MRKLLYLVSLILIISCNSESSKNNPAEKATETTFDFEKNLKLNAQDYINIWLKGDIENADEYIHPIQWELLKLKFPNEPDIYSIKRKIMELNRINGIEKFNTEYNMKFKLGEILDSVNLKDEIIYTLIYTEEGETKYNKIYIKSALIGISTNKKNNWKFIMVDENFASQIILLLTNYYPKDVVQRISNTIFLKEEVSVFKSKFHTNNIIEENLINQFYDYYTSLFKGDADRAVNYIYSGVFQHYKDIMPGNNSLEEVKIYFKETVIKPLQEGNLAGDNEIDFNVQKILNKVTYGTDMIYVLGYSLLKTNKNENYSMGGAAIAISSDSGKNWKFFEKDDQFTFPILSNNFPNSVVLNILNY